MIWLFVFIICIAVAINYWYIKTLKSAFKERLDAERKDKQVFIDRTIFHLGLFFKTAVKYKLNRNDFREIVVDTYDWLPIRGGGISHKDFPGFWESIFAAYDVKIHYNSKGEFTPDAESGKKLADAIWLGYDQDVEKGKLHLLMTKEQRERALIEEDRKYQI